MPVDRLLAGYLLLASLALVFPHRPTAWPAFLLAHLALAALLLSRLPARARLGPAESPGTSRFGRLARRLAAGLAEWYPLLLMPFLYWELPFLGGAIWDGRYFDPLVLGWEEALFGHQPSTTLARRWDLLPLSELLHLAYLSYYPVIYFFPAALFLSGRLEAFRRTIFALMLGFTATYVVFIVFPVQGPRYLFPAPGGELARGALYGLTHSILESGSSRGAAFPSAHMAIATIQTLSAIRHRPRWAPLLALVTLGIGLGAVYGGFHYGIDMLAGLAVGLVLAAVAPWARRALQGGALVAEAEAEAER